MNLPQINGNLSSLSQVQSFQSTSKRSSLVQNTNNNKAIVSVNCVDQSSMVSSFSNQCIIDKQESNGNNKVAKSKETSSTNLKKKRTAFENISNANNGTSMNCNNASKEIAKKSRFGNSVSGVNSQVSQVNLNIPVTKKVEALSKKSSHKSIPSSKENLTFLHSKNLKPPELQSKPISSNLSKSDKYLYAGSQLSIKASNKKESATVEGSSELKNDMKKTSQDNSKSLFNFLANPEHDEKKRHSKIDLSPEQITGWEEIDLEESDEFSANNYVGHIFKYYKEREEKFKIGDYLKRQPCINKQMRLLLVDWMVEVQQQLEFNHEVLYLSVKLLDIYLNSRQIDKEKLQLLGGAAMFIACKFEERMPPIIDDFIYVSDNAFDRNELIKMEIEILKTVHFDIGIPLSYTFLRRYSKCVKADMKFLTLARYILELSLQDYNFSYVRDSLKASAALYLALRMTASFEINIEAILSNPNKNLAICSSLPSNHPTTVNLSSTEWNVTLIHYTGLFLKDFIHYIPAMNNLIKSAPTSKYKTIHNKYSHQVFYEVAKIPPLTETEISQLLSNCEKNHQKLIASQVHSM